MSYHWLSTLSFLIVVLLTHFATAAAQWDEMRIMHTWNSVPANWESLGNTTDRAMINLHVALQPERESALIDTLFEVSNPSHPRYGAFLSKEQAAELVNPHPETLDLVRAWLVHHGIRPSSISTTHGGSWLTIKDVLVSQANQLLGASYQMYRNSKTNNKIIRTVGYALPAVLHAHIRTVAPTTYFPSMRGMRQTPRRRSYGAAPEQAEAASGKVVRAQPEAEITPSALRWLYGTEAYRVTGPYGDANRLGILGIDDDYPSPLDLYDFMAKYRSEAIDAWFTVEHVNSGKYNPSDPFDGASVTVQYASAIAYPNSVVFYSVGGDKELGPYGRPIAGDMYLEWLNYLLEEKSPPSAILIGYGEPELDLPEAYAWALCGLFAKLGARGVTILVASGWNGVGEEGNCVNAYGHRRFMPEFPASCPYVTSVGGTAKFRPEMATNLSGGGFSFYFARPDYQDLPVQRYLWTYDRYYEDLYNSDGRGYPDISAQALNYQYIINGEMNYMNGTICSASTVAGMISLINFFRLLKFRPMLGFVNPLLYSHKFKGIKDIILGGNSGCGTDGFVAAEGWDPATGLGTLDFEKLLDFPGD